MSITESIFVGVFSGVLTTIIIFLFSKFIKKIAIPWYQNTVFKGLDISGIWNNEFSFNGSVLAEQTLELEQKGHLLSGQMSSIYKMKKPSVTISFKIEGEIFDNYIFLRYKPTDKRHLGGGSIMLKIVEGGSKLEGGLVAIDRFTSDVMVSKNSDWTRID